MQLSREEQDSFESLKNLIKIGRIHLYKPIQIAEILHRDRKYSDIVLRDIETYRIKSKVWRDLVSTRLVGNKSSSSSKFQDDVFSETAIPPEKLHHLGEVNKRTGGSVEQYIYNEFRKRNSQMSSGLDYCIGSTKSDFDLTNFINLFWQEAGLRRSIDKIYEIIVYSLFSTLVEKLDISIILSLNKNNHGLLKEFEDFTFKVLQLSSNDISLKVPAKIFRVGVANAADRGLDMWATFGLALQVKHLSLTEELAEDISNSITADRIVIICKDCEKRLILSLLNQIGWKAKIQSIITEQDLIVWYEKGLRGPYAHVVGDLIMENLREQIAVEFPATNDELSNFFQERSYKII